MTAAATRVLSLIPPMTQLNTPYPSAPYLTGFLRSRGVDAVQADLVLALVLTLPGYALGRFGAGDVKLLAALGLASNTEYLLGSLIGAGIAMLAWTLIHQGLGSGRAERAEKASTKQPFAPFVLIGFAGCWLWMR